MWGGAQPAPHRWLFVSSPEVELPPPPGHPHRRLSLKATCASTPTRVLAGGGSTRHQPRIVPAQSMPPPPLSASGVRRDAATGLAFLLFVLAVVMSSFLSLAIFSFPAWRQLESAAHKLSKVVAEEVPGTLWSLKLSFMEISDLTSQLKNLRQSLTVNRSGKMTNAVGRSRTG